MYVWKDAAHVTPHVGHSFAFLSDNYLVHLDDGTTCEAFYDRLVHKWCSAETALPFPVGQVIEWRDKVEINR